MIRPTEGSHMSILEASPLSGDAAPLSGVVPLVTSNRALPAEVDDSDDSIAGGQGTEGREGLLPSCSTTTLTFLAVGLSLMAMVSGFTVWAVRFCSNSNEFYWVCFWGGASYAKNNLIQGLNYLWGRHWFLSKFLGMSEADMDLLYRPAQIPLKKWIHTYGENRIKVRDALQRKVPHFVDGTLNMVFWTAFINGNSPDPLAVIALQTFHRAAWLITSLGLFVVHQKTGYWASWVLSGAWRIRDGNLRFENSVSTTLGTIWGAILTKMLWCFLLVPVYPPSERALLLQLCWLPCFVGDAMAEIVGTIWGKRFFTVPGIGDINMKTMEGVFAMFLSSVIANMSAVVAADGRLQTPGYWVWIVPILLICILATVAETFSPRSTDNFTIPLAGVLVLAVSGRYGPLSGIGSLGGTDYSGFDVMGA